MKRWLRCVAATLKGSYLLAAIAVLLVVAVRLPADDDPFAEEPSVINQERGKALIVCGLPGDADHRKLFAETVEKLYSGLTTRLGFLPERVAVLFSDEATEKDGPALRANRGP